MTSLEELPDETGNRALMTRISGSALGPFLGLILVFCLFAMGDIINSNLSGKRISFLTVSTAQQLLRDSSLTAVAALGMLLIIIAGGIDLSVGTGIALCATVTAWLFREGYPTAAALFGGVATGCLIGMMNGVLITSLKLVPFIVTLGTMSILRGIGLILSNPSRINASAQTPDWVKELQIAYPQPKWLLVSTGVWVTLFLAVLVGMLLKYSVFGRRVFAIGSNEATARLCGIDVSTTQIAVYTVAGFFTGVAGLFFFAMSSGDVDPNDGVGKELVIIAAVVIGGGSLNGGRGSLLGMLAGAGIIETITHGCTILGIGTRYQHVIIGAIIVTAVALDQLRQRRLRE